MKKVIMFYIDGCPYCAKAKRALQELKEEKSGYDAVNVEMINEQDHPEISKNYKYYYVPTFFVGEEKIYEAQPGDSFEEVKAHVREVLAAALQ